ncbi:MAG: hypothetical protein IAF58_09000, partial [Leptolyngbya sp.]|nr:hypothetical protein [Candidatus Melainabacteria bacterium]
DNKLLQVTPSEKSEKNDQFDLPSLWSGVSALQGKATELPQSMLAAGLPNADELLQGLGKQFNRTLDEAQTVFDSTNTKLAGHFDAPLTQTQKMDSIEQSMSRVFAQNRSTSTDLDMNKVNSDFLGGYLGKNTFAAPMNDDSYAANATRSYERLLMARLSTQGGSISHEKLLKEAIKACDGDEAMAVLTLANFTKNLASVERNQAGVIDRPLNTWPENTYQTSKAKQVFSRIEGFADNPNQRYDREGSLYHFYGAMAAEYLAGLGGVGVTLERTVFAKNDGIENAAGVLGVKIAQKAVYSELQTPGSNMMRPR